MKEEKLTIRLSKLQKDKIREASDKAGIGMSQFIKSIVFQKIRELENPELEKKVIVKNVIPQELADVFNEANNKIKALGIKQDKTTSMLEFITSEMTKDYIEPIEKAIVKHRRTRITMKDIEESMPYEGTLIKTIIRETKLDKETIQKTLENNPKRFKLLGRGWNVVKRK